MQSHRDLNELWQRNVGVTYGDGSGRSITRPQFLAMVDGILASTKRGNNGGKSKASQSSKGRANSQANVVRKRAQSAGALTVAKAVHERHARGPPVVSSTTAGTAPSGVGHSCRILCLNAMLTAASAEPRALVARFTQYILTLTPRCLSCCCVRVAVAVWGAGLAIPNPNAGIHLHTNGNQ